MNETRPPTGAEAPPALAEPPAAAPPPPHPRRVLTPRNYVWIAGAAIVIFLGLRYLGPVLTPFLIAAILAYRGSPIVAWAEKHRISRGLATTVVVLLFGFVLLLLFLVLIPLVQSEVSLAARRIPDLVSQGIARISPWLEQ